MLIDGSTFIYSYPPQSGTFAEYSEMSFAGKIAQISQNDRRVDIIFDKYKKRQLKSLNKKIKGNRRMRCKITLRGKIPNK